MAPEELFSILLGERSHMPAQNKAERWRKVAGEHEEEERLTESQEEDTQEQPPRLLHAQELRHPQDPPLTTPAKPSRIH